jgi:hypothetical protein
VSGLGSNLWGLPALFRHLGEEAALSTSLYDPRPPGAASHDGSLSAGLAGEDHVHRRISWGAILGGVVLVITFQMMMSLLGAGIGLQTVDLNAGTTPNASSLGTGAGVWWVASSCLSLLIGSYVAAWVAGIEIRFDGVVHGLVTWGIATLLTVWLLSSAISGVVGSGFNALGSVASATGNGVSAAAKPLAQATGLTPDMIQQQSQAFLQSSNQDPASMSPQDAQKAVASNLGTYLAGGSDASAARDRVIDIMAGQMKISHDEAQRRFDETATKVRQTRDQAVQKAREAADATAAAASKTSFAAFGVMVVGALFAAIGGAMAVQRRIVHMARLG